MQKLKKSWKNYLSRSLTAVHCFGWEGISPPAIRCSTNHSHWTLPGSRAGRHQLGTERWCSAAQTGHWNPFSFLLNFNIKRIKGFVKKAFVTHAPLVRRCVRCKLWCESNLQPSLPSSSNCSLPATPGHWLRWLARPCCKYLPILRAAKIFCSLQFFSLKQTIISANRRTYFWANSKYMHCRAPCSELFEPDISLKMNEDIK